MDKKRGRMTKPAAVADLLVSVLHGKPAEKRIKEGRIWLLWDSAVGEQISSKAYPVSFRNGILTVAVSSAPWMQQLNFLKRSLIEKLNSSLGEQLVQEIHLKAGTPPPLTAEPVTPPKKLRPLTKDEEQWVSELSSTISDLELRESVAGLLAKYISERY